MWGNKSWAASWMHNRLILNSYRYLEIRNIEVFLFAYTTLIMTFMVRLGLNICRRIFCPHSSHLNFLPVLTSLPERTDAKSHMHPHIWINIQYLYAVTLSNSSHSTAAQGNCWAESLRPFWDLDQLEDIKVNWPYDVLLTTFIAVVLWLLLALIGCWPASSCPQGIRVGMCKQIGL